jgi:RNA polymerase sigma-70 factor (ECF subfamily)
MQADIRHQMIALLPRLRRFARGLAGSRDDADDLVQGACERALRSIDSWQPGTRLDSWMYRILHNLWVDQHRRRRHEAPIEDADLKVGGEDGRRTAESRLELAEVRAQIAALPEPQRDVLVLVCIEDMSYREAAETLSVPIGTVMSRLARARASLAAALADKEPKPAAHARGAALP